MRAPPLLLLLLMAAAGVAVSPLARLNPWLSACDLAEEDAGGASDCGGAACGGGGAAEVLSTRDLPRLCALGADVRARRLEKQRLRACCERSPASALDRAARADVAAGGQRCEGTLRDLIELDMMAARVHCDFASILSRYDCGQPYSVHRCTDCQDTYRRWACSTLVPLWVEEGEAEEPGTRSRRAPPEARNMRWRARHLERVGHLDRRRGGVIGRWVRAAAAGPGRPHTPIFRLKPCLSVCQLVEQHCPYFLPADRAPAYPTQYAGEPTFLCLDSRIPETGEQANNSNYGLEDCCYWHCKDGLCYKCESRLSEPRRPEAERCVPVEERVSTCSAPAASNTTEKPAASSTIEPAAASSTATPPSASSAAAPPALVALLAAVVVVLRLAPPFYIRTRRVRTAPVPLVNVRNERL